MAAVLGVLGLVLIAVANYDVLVTTLAIGSGARPLTAHMAEMLRRLLRRFPRLMSAGGPIVVLATIGTWISLLWLGYSLVFVADPDAITSSIGGEPAAAVSRVYYAGYTLFTLGNGGYAPAVGLWEIVTVLATLNGMFVVTLAITYLVPVVSAVVERRKLASFVHALGETSEEVAVAAWDGTGFGYLEGQLPNVAEQILLNAQRHLAYPVLHDFYSSDRASGSARTLAMIEDVVTLLSSGVPQEIALSPPLVRTVRYAIDESLRLMPVEAGDTDVPPDPDPRALAAADIPTASSAALAADLAGNADRRRHLAALLDASARAWPNRAGQSAATPTTNQSSTFSH